MFKRAHSSTFFQYRSEYCFLTRLHLFLLSALVFTTSIIAQSTYPFVHYNDENGLSNNYISAIYQDSKGFIWIGTQYGLNKFDGHNFTIYTSKSKDTTSLKANWVLSIAEAKDSTLWIGTYKGGLNKFDPVKEVFTAYMATKDSTSIQSDIVNKVKCDSRGRIWIGTPKGISQFIPKNNKFKKFTTANTAAIEEDTAGHIWIVTAGKLMYFDELAQHFKPVNYPIEKKVTSIIADKEKGLWVLLDNNYLIRLDTDNDLMQLHTIDSLKYTQFTEKTIFNTFSTQPVIFTPDKQNIIEFISEEDKLLTITEDRQNNIWLGTESGIKFWSPYTDRFGNDRFNKDVSNIYTRNLLLDGDYLWYIEKETLYKWNILEKGNSPIRILDGCSGLFQSKDRTIYTYSKNPGRLYKVDPDTHKTKSFYLGVSNNIFSMAEDKNNRIWIGVWGILSCFDPEKEEFVLKFEVNEQYGLTSTDFLNLLVDDGGNLWMGDLTKGLFFLPQAHQIKREEEAGFTNYDHQPDNPNSLSSNLVQALHKDNTGNIWVGTDSGLNKFNPKNENFQRFSKEDGLTNDKIITMTSDTSNRLWIGTSGGLFCLNISKNNFQKFTTEDGLHSNAFRLTAVFRSLDNTLLFGTEKGIQIFHPDNIFKDITYNIPVYLTELQINGALQSIHTPPDSLLSKHISFTKELTLKPHHNTVTFRFAALHYFLPEKTEYFYWLEGFHSTLQYAGKANEITFGDLPPGAYTLKIEAVREDLGWKATANPLTITVLKPWWKSWWAYLLYSIAFISLVTIGFVFRSQRLKTVQKKAAQLQELTRIKNESFDNITHELRSPLANILGMNKQIVTPGQLSHEYIATIIEKNGRTLLYRINQLLDLTKSETGKLSVSYIQGDIITYLDAIIKRFYPLAAAKNIKLHFESEWEVESLTMDYDPDKLLSIIANLLTNALKYTQEKGKVTLHAGIIKKRDKKILQLKVKDTGIGIPADKIPYIFDRFYQVNTTNQIHKGTGIGLALAKEFTELMKGTISVKSQVDKGSEFTVRLPISYSASTPGAPDEDTVKEKLTLYTLGIHQTSNRKKEYSVVTDMPIVLIIEDDPDMGEVLHAFLRDTYSLQFAANGKEGIAKAIDFIPDIILSDVVMPEKNGFEVCEAIKKDKRTSHIPVILLTAMADENTKYEGLERGAYHFLTKPVDKKELLVKLRNLLEHRNRIKRRYSVFAPPARAEDKNFQREVHFMQEFKQKVAENYHKTAFGAEPLAALLNMTRDQLYRKFKALTDEYTPAAYIKTFRLNKAKELLITTDSYSYTISEIAFSVGYGDLPAFTRAFKRTFGMSPGSFRKNYHNSQKDD